MSKITVPAARRRIAAAQSAMRVRHEATIDRSSMYSRGLSPGGWNAGYMAALSDVVLLLNGNDPVACANGRTADLWRDVANHP